MRVRETLAVAEIQHDTYHDGACHRWIEMLVQGELGRNNAGRRAARAALPGRRSPRARARTKTLTGPKFTSSKNQDTPQGLGWL